MAPGTEERLKKLAMGKAAIRQFQIELIHIVCCNVVALGNRMPSRNACPGNDETSNDASRMFVSVVDPIRGLDCVCPAC
jgi:hypothetical protein